MFQFKETEYTLSTFMNTLKKVGEDISYVGTFYESTMLDKSIIAHPTLNVEHDKDQDLLYIDVILKPGAGAEADQVDVLGSYLRALGTGFMGAHPEVLKKEHRDKHLTPMSKFLSQNTATSNIQDHEVTIIFSEPVVKRMDTVIRGVPYFKYAISEKVDLGEGVFYTHTVHCLFKEKEWDAENFFSALTGESLSKRDTLKVLDSLAHQNITGYFIGGYDVYPNNSRGKQTMITAFHSTMSPIEIKKSYESYYISVTISGGTFIPTADINSSSVRRVGDGRYVLELNTSYMTVNLYLG